MLLAAELITLSTADRRTVWSSCVASIAFLLLVSLPEQKFE